MANTKFDAKSFNPEAFKYLVGRVPNLKMNELLKSRAVSTNADIANLFRSQDGTSYARMAMRGLIDGDVLNYDGETDIVATSTKTFERGVVCFGRAKAWTEKDFSYDITGGKDFMSNVAEQVAEYWDEKNQDVLLSILKGIFSMSGTKNLEFVNKHTTEVEGNMDSTTLNSATGKACGDNKKKFSMVFMHSDVATNLENLNVLKHITYTDGAITRDLSLATWNGKMVVIDDSMPTEAVAQSGETPAYTKYTTYVLGDGAFDFADIGAKVPYEMARDPYTDGGNDTLITRERMVFAPMGISYEKKSQATLSPTNAELENGENWSLVHSGESVAANRSFINHRAIPIARIISRG